MQMMKPWWNLPLPWVFRNKPVLRGSVFKDCHCLDCNHRDLPSKQVCPWIMLQVWGFMYVVAIMFYRRSPNRFPSAKFLDLFTCLPQAFDKIWRSLTGHIVQASFVIIQYRIYSPQVVSRIIYNTGWFDRSKLQNFKKICKKVKELSVSMLGVG